MGDRSKNVNPFVGKIIRQLRERTEVNGKKMTQAELGKVVFKGESTVRMWELGKSEPDAETIKTLADYFNVSVDYLLGINEKSPPAEQEGKGLVIPEKYKDVAVAFAGGTENLTQEDIDDIVRFIEFTKDKAKRK